MAILKYILSFIPLLLLCSCYTDFEPALEAKPVLCMNSLLTSGEPVEVSLTHTWRFSAGKPDNRDINVADADIEVYANGRFIENLVYDPGDADDKNSRQPVYRGQFVPSPDDQIELRAHHPSYGEAFASVVMPRPVPITKVTPDIEFTNCLPSSYINTYTLKTGFITEFTDPGETDNYYTVEVSVKNPKPIPSDVLVTIWPDNTQKYVDYTGNYQFDRIDFEREPIFSEHLSNIDHLLDSSAWGYSFFSDQQINGKSYPLQIHLIDCLYYVLNPKHIESLYHSEIIISLGSISADYYKYMLSMWKVNSGFEGELGNNGLADPIFIYSNVSTGAGIVAARSVSKYTVDLSDYVRDLPYQDFNPTK